MYVWEDPSGYNYETDYTYDALNNLLSVTQKGGSSASSNWRTRAFVYDSLSRLTSATNPESGTISYSYDANGNLAQKTSPKPNQSTPTVTTKLNFCYDNLNRVTSKSYNSAACPATSPQDTYTYDQGTYSVGHRTGMTDTPGSSAWTYDPMGRIASETRVTSNITKTTSYLYNKDGSVQSITYPSTRSVNYTYGGAGRTLSVIDPTGPINYATSATYSPHGGLSTLTNGLVTGAGAFPGITSADTYSNRLQPVLVSATSPTASIIGLCYDFHLKVAVSSPPCPTFNANTGDNGNVYQIVNHGDGNRTQNFSYDPLNRISQGYTSGTNWGEIYTIDPWGNLTNIGPKTGKGNSETLNAPALINNQLTGFGYDAAGNVISNGIMGYTYDAENHLTKFVDNTSDIYLYDGDGNRVKKNASSVTLYWYGATGNILDETDGTGNLVSEYIFFNGKRIARRDAGVSERYYFSDNLGSASVITDNQGVIKEESDYYPFGGEIVIASADSNHYKFTGKERDAESGLDYFGARYYASSMGRFMSPDPLYIEMHRLADPQQLNLYMYGRNNPLSITDPTGLDITCGGTRCADYLSGLQKDIKGFKIGYDKNGKVETVGDVDKKGLSKSDKAFLGAIDDTKNHVTINAIGGAGDASTFFGASHGSTHTINFDQAALLDGPANAGGMTSASLVGHETLEGYDEAKGYSMMDGHNWAASLGFPGMSPMAGGSYSTQNGMVIGITGNFQIQGTNTVETIGTRFVTPIPQADFLKNARSDHPTASPAYPVSVEKKQ